jgi:hypothetical protein
MTDHRDDDAVSDKHANPSRAVMAFTLIAGTCAAALPVLAVVILLLSRSPELDHGFDTTQAFCIATWLTVSASALWLIVELTQPGASGGLWKLLLPAPILIGSGIAVDFARTPSNTWPTRIVPLNPAACITMILLFSMPILTSIFYVLRGIAVASPLLAGGAAGVLAGSVSATIYVWHCPESSYSAAVLWHGCAVLAVGAIAAYLGRQYVLTPAA